MRWFILILMMFASLGQIKAFAEFIPVTGIDDADIRRVVISPLEPDIIWAGSKNTLYKSSDTGKTFIAVQSFKDEQINHIFADSRQTGTIYIVASRHVYRFTDHSEAVFTASDEEIVNCAAVYADELFVAASKGLYRAKLSAGQWQKIPGIQESAVAWVESGHNCVYVVCSRGVYTYKEKEGLIRGLVSRESEENDPIRLVLGIVVVDKYDSQKIWLGSNKGIFVSLNSGGNWQKLVIAGIDSIDARCIAQTESGKNIIYCASNKGLFKVDIKNKIAESLFEGISSGGVYWLDFAANGSIYAATSRGLMVDACSNPNNNFAGLEEVMIGEPDIDVIQKAAIRYNETHPEKIRAWSRAVKCRALMPTFSLNYDKVIYGTYANGGQFAVGPRDWGMSFSWDMGNLIWNTYEDDIDTRARLNTQLRLDILDEINRIYFERLRLKHELFTKHFSEDERFGKQLRFRELTAVIDGYTGGLFTRISKKNNKKL